MHSRIRLARHLLRLLDASPLPLTDRVRLALEREALDWLAPVSEVRVRVRSASARPCG